MMEMPPLPEKLVKHAAAGFGYVRPPAPRWNDDDMRAYGESCARMAREEAAKIAEETIVAEFEGVDYYGDKAAAAIRKG